MASRNGNHWHSFPENSVLHRRSTAHTTENCWQYTRQFVTSGSWLKLGNSSWTEALPWVLLGIRSAWKEDIGGTTAELVYGEPLRLPGQFLTEAPKDFVDMSDLVDRLRAHMTKLTLQPTSWHSSSNRPFYIPKDLSTSTHVFLREGPGRRSLQAPYTGPQRVFAHNHKTVDIEVNGKRQRVTIDRVKPAYMAREELEPSQNRPQTPHPAQPDEPVRKTRSGRTVKFPDHYRP